MAGRSAGAACFPIIFHKQKCCMCKSTNIYEYVLLCIARDRFGYIYFVDKKMQKVKKKTTLYPMSTILITERQIWYVCAGLQFLTLVNVFCLPGKFISLSYCISIYILQIGIYMCSWELLFPLLFHASCQC